MNDHNTLDRLHRHFARQLGCQPEDLAQGNQQIVTCDLRGNGNSATPQTPLWAISRGNGWVVSVVSEAYSPANNVLQALPSNQTPLSDQARRRLHESIRKVAPVSFYCYGPLFYVDRESFRPYTAHPVHRLTLEDLPLLLRNRHPLAQAMNQIEAGDVFALLQGDAVLSHAQILRCSEEVWEITVMTEADHRGQGCAKSVVSAATEAVLDAGRIPVYSCDDHNRASRCVAKALGYQKYADDFVCLGRISR